MLRFFNPCDGLPWAEADSPLDLWYELLGHVIDKDVAEVVVTDFEDFGGGLLALGVPFALVVVDGHFHGGRILSLERVVSSPGV